MLSHIPQHHIHNTIVPMIDNGTAQRIDNACFVDGNEDEYVVEFFKLWGRYIRTCYNRRNTRTDYHFVDGQDADTLALYSSANWVI